MPVSFFKPASRKKSRLRMAIDGPSGAGKTFTALRLAFTLAGPDGRVAVINTESGAVEKYEGLSPDGIPWKFDVGELSDFAPSTYTSAIQAAGREGYDVVIVDSLSHAWEGESGALDQVDRRGGNRFTAWKDVTPQHRRMIESILRSPCHVICTMRSKMEYVLEQDEKGRSVPRKVGLAPIQRAGTEYEFDVVADMDWNHTLTVSKTRCPLIDGAIVVKPGAAFIQPVAQWLQDGSDVPADYYAVTDEELQAAANGQSQEQEKPAKDWREEMKRKAEKRAEHLLPSPADRQGQAEDPPWESKDNEQPAEPTTEPAADRPADAAVNEKSGSVTTEQLAQLSRLFDGLKTPDDKRSEILSRRGVCRTDGRPYSRPRPAMLSEAAAGELLPKLESLLESQRREELGFSEEEAERVRHGNEQPEPAGAAAPKN